MFRTCGETKSLHSLSQMQVIADALTEKHQFQEEMHPEALLYRNLWLKALRALKYKNYALSMKHDGMDGCKSIKK